MKIAVPIIALCVGIAIGRFALSAIPTIWPLGKPTPAAMEIAEQFSHGTITRSDVSPLSISEIATEWKGHSILITWYPTHPRSLRTLVIDGTEGVFPTGIDERVIFNAALGRADHLVEEKMQDLENSK